MSEHQRLAEEEVAAVLAKVKHCVDELKQQTNQRQQQEEEHSLPSRERTKVEGEDEADAAKRAEHEAVAQDPRVQRLLQELRARRQEEAAGAAEHESRAARMRKMQAELELVQRRMRLVGNAHRSRGGASEMAEEVKTLEALLASGRQRLSIAATRASLASSLAASPAVSPIASPTPDEFALSSAQAEVVALREERARLVRRVETQQGDLGVLRDREGRLRVGVVMRVQAVARGRRVRRTLQGIDDDVRDVRRVSMLLCRKLRLHLPLIRVLLLSRDAIGRALESELVCRNCFQKFEDPVWLLQGPKREARCEVCASDVAGEDIAVGLASTVPHQLLRDLQALLAAKQARFAKAADTFEAQKRQLVLQECFGGLLTAPVLSKEHVRQRIKDAGLC